MSMNLFTLTKSITTANMTSKKTVNNNQSKELVDETVWEGSLKAELDSIADLNIDYTPVYQGIVDNYGEMEKPNKTPNRQPTDSGKGARKKETAKPKANMNKPTQPMTPGRSTRSSNKKQEPPTTREPSSESIHTSSEDDSSDPEIKDIVGGSKGQTKGSNMVPVTDPITDKTEWSTIIAALNRALYHYSRTETRVTGIFAENGQLFFSLQEMSKKASASAEPTSKRSNVEPSCSRSVEKEKPRPSKKECAPIASKTKLFLKSKWGRPDCRIDLKPSQIQILQEKGESIETVKAILGETGMGSSIVQAYSLASFRFE